MQVWAELRKTNKNGTSSNRKPLPPLTLEAQEKEQAEEVYLESFLKGAVTLCEETQQTYGGDLAKRVLRNKHEPETGRSKSRN